MDNRHQTGNTERSDRQMLAVAWALWTLLFSAYSIFLHETYRTASLDLGLHNQVLWNLAHGRYMETTLLPDAFAGHHFWPVLYVLMPVYLALGTFGVLIAQAGIVAAGVFPAFWLAHRITNSRRWAWVFAAAYLLHPTPLSCVLFDYHPELFTMPCLLGAFLALERNRRGLFLVMCVLTLATYEVAGIVLLPLGLMLLCSPRHCATGLFLVVVVSLYSAMAVGVMQHFRTGPPVTHWERYARFGPDLPSAALNIVAHPLHALRLSVTGAKIRNLVYLGASVGFLFILSPARLLPSLPLLFLLGLSKFSPEFEIRFEYFAPVVPFWIWASMHGAAKLEAAYARRTDGTRCAAPAWMAVLLALQAVHFVAQIPIRSHLFVIRSNLASIREAAALVPGDASLSADMHLGAHFPNRRVLLLMPELERQGQRTDYVFLDLDDASDKGHDYWRCVANLLADPEYERVYAKQHVVLLRHKVAADAKDPPNFGQTG